MTKLDGNVLAGRLADLLGWDATTAEARCRQCGDRGEIARTAVYSTRMGTVVRCDHCDAVLAVFVDADDGRSWFAMPGISALEVTR